MRKKKRRIQQLLDIQELLDASVAARNGVVTDRSLDGQIRGVAAALAILRGTSSTQEVMESERREGSNATR